MIDSRWPCLIISSACCETLPGSPGSLPCPWMAIAISTLYRPWMLFDALAAFATEVVNLRGQCRYTSSALSIRQLSIKLTSNHFRRLSFAPWPGSVDSSLTNLSQQFPNSPNFSPITCRSGRPVGGAVVELEIIEVGGGLILPPSLSTTLLRDHPDPNSQDPYSHG